MGIRGVETPASSCAEVDVVNMMWCEPLRRTSKFLTPQNLTHL